MEKLTFEVRDAPLREKDRIVGKIRLTVELDPSRVGGEEGEIQLALAVPAGDGLNADEARVWSHYQTTIPDGARYRINPKRQRIIYKALQVRSLERCLEAIDGLAKSPHHNGQNEQQKKYLDIRYALAGIGQESDDERIDKMAALAGTSFVARQVPSGQREMVRERSRHLEDWLRNPGDPRLRERGELAQSWFRRTFHQEGVIEDDVLVLKPATGIVFTEAAE